MKRFVLLGELMWIGGAVLAIGAAAGLFYLYHATGLAAFVTSLIAP